MNSASFISQYMLFLLQKFIITSFVLSLEPVSVIIQPEIIFLTLESSLSIILLSFLTIMLRNIFLEDMSITLL